MKNNIAYSNNKDIQAAVKEIKEALPESSDLILCFTSSLYDNKLIAKELHNAFPAADTFGCTTSGELVSGKMMDHSIVAMAFERKIIGEYKVEIVPDVAGNCETNVKKAMSSFESFFGERVDQMDFEKYVGMVLIDGLSGAEEKVNDAIGNCTSVSFVGGSAGDDLKFEATHVFYNGVSYNNAAVLALMKPNRKFSILKTQSFKVLDKKLKVTKTNESERRVIEFNGSPAAKAYAEAIGIEEKELVKFFSKNPLGLILFDKKDPFVRSPRILDNKDVLFYCSMKEGAELNLLESSDIIENTRKDLSAKIEEMESVSAIINFNCILRTLELKDKNQEAAYGEIFNDVPTIGFSTYGESYIGHINQTATMLIFN